MSLAGNWSISVSEPYPVWIGVSYQGRELVRVRHDELRDLEYAIGRAVMEARAKLPLHAKDEME